MSRLLVVEDEPIERSFLVQSLRSLDLNIEEVLEATDGKAGLECFERLRPDIVLADIVMPRMNGLDMLCRIKEIAPDTVCYVLSSYNTFDYARSALRMGIEDFLLKPCARDDLHHAIEQAMELCAQRSSRLEKQSEMVTRLNSYQTHIEKDLFDAAVHRQDDASIKETMDLLGIPESSEVLAAIFEDLVDGSLENDLHEHGWPAMLWQEGSRRIMLLFADAFDQASLASLYDIFQDHHIRCSFSSCTSSTRLASLFENTPALPAAPKSVQKMPEENPAASFARLFSDQKKAEDEEICLKHLRKLCAGPLPGPALAQFGRECAQSLCEVYSLQTDFVFLGDLLAELDPEFDLPSFLFKEMKNFAEGALLQKRLLQKSGPLAQAYQYVLENYVSPISLQSVSATLNLSPYYLSRLLNRETQESFTDLINRLRIEEAKRLIRAGKSIKEASWRAGFAYQNYFSKVFKKLVELSPREYRSIFR